MSTDFASIPRLERLHAVVFATGTVAMVLGIIVSSPSLLMIAGACLVLSGLLIFVGSRITLRGALGDALRLALGHRRVFTLYLRAVFWMALGSLLILLAAQTGKTRDELPLRPRIAAQGS